jgi:hypothetical protein
MKSRRKQCHFKFSKNASKCELPFTTNPEGFDHTSKKGAGGHSYLKVYIQPSAGIAELLFE